MNTRKLALLMIVTFALFFLAACEAGTAEPTEAPAVDTPVIEAPTAAAYPNE